MTTETEVNKDIDTIASLPSGVFLLSGTEIEVERLRTRQTMALLKILTSGAASLIPTLQFSADMDASDFTGQLLGMVVLSIPEAEDETIEFINRMVSPANLIVADKGRISKAEGEINAERIEDLRRELDNPELEDLVTIMEVIIENEAPHILALGKRLALLLNLQTQSASAKSKTSSSKSSKG